MGKGQSWFTWGTSLIAGAAGAVAAQQVAADKVGGDRSDPIFTAAVIVAGSAEALQLLLNCYWFYHQPHQRTNIIANVVAANITTAVAVTAGVLAGACGSAAKCFFTEKSAIASAGTAITSIGHAFGIFKCEKPNRGYQKINSDEETNCCYPKNSK